MAALQEYFTALGGELLPAQKFTTHVFRFRFVPLKLNLTLILTLTVILTLTLLRARLFCGMRIVESCQGVICGKSSAERSSNYRIWLFGIPQPKNSAFLRLAKLPFAHIVQQMCSRCTKASGFPQFLASVVFVVRLPKNSIFFTVRLSSKSLLHSKCHIISLIDVIGFNLYNRCDSGTDDRTNHI